MRPPLPLSAAQLGIWFAQHLDPATLEYNVGEYIDIHGPVDAVLFEHALRQIVAEAETLRAKFVECDDGPQQVILDSPPWSMPHVDVSAEPNAQAAAIAWMKADLARPFDLRRGPLFQYALLKLGPDRFFWHARYHHIVTDAFGMSLVAERAAQVYSALVEGHTNSGRPLEPLAPLVAADAEYRASEEFVADRQFWLQYLADLPSPISLSQRNPARPSGFIRCTRHLGTKDLSPPVAATGPIRAAPATAIVAAAAIFLHRMTGAHDVILRFPVSARSPAARNIPGMVSNLVPLRLKISPHMSVSDVVAETAHQMRTVRQRQRLRIADLRQDIGGTDQHRTAIAGPTVNIMRFNYNFSFAGSRSFAHNLATGPIDDLSIAMYDRLDGGGVRIDFDANPARYGTDEIAGHLNRFVRLLERTIAAPHQTIGSLDILSPDERQTILRGWNDTRRPLMPVTLPALFASQTAKTPEAIAVVFEDCKLTYAELDALSNQLAHHLQWLGVRPETIVGLCFERSVEMIVALVAILKAGGAYLPLDPTYPAERLQFMLEDSGAPILLTHSHLRGKVRGPSDAIVEIDTDAAIARQTTDAVLSAVAPSNAAYVIYTSGSTGRPKAVVVSHLSVSNYVAWGISACCVDEGIGAPILNSLAFDATVTALFLPLFAGKLVMLAREDKQLSSSRTAME